MSSKSTIKTLNARQIWSQGGGPAIELEITLRYGASGRAVVEFPNTAAMDLNRMKFATAWIGSDLHAYLKGRNAADQLALDEYLTHLPPTEQASPHQAEIIAAVSLAAIRAIASAEKLPLWQYLGDFLGETDEFTLPLPALGIAPTDSLRSAGLTFRQLALWPVGATSFGQALHYANAVNDMFRTIQIEPTEQVGTAPSEAFWVEQKLLNQIVQAIERAGLKPGDDVGIGLDVGASRFGQAGFYRPAGGTPPLSADELSGLYADWVSQFPIVQIENPFADDDPEGFKRLTWAIGRRVRISKSLPAGEAMQNGAGNTTGLDMCQPWTISRLRRQLANDRNANRATMMDISAQKSGEVAAIHLAVGWGLDEIKFAHPSHMPSVINWNEGLRIAEMIPTVSRSDVTANGPLPPKSRWGQH